MIKCLELNISESCNYDCVYCIFKRNNKANRFMSPLKARKYADKYVEYLNGRKGHIYLGAGEPLLNWDAIVAVSECVKNTPNVWLSFMTNASLMTEDKVDFIKDRNIAVGVSLDGKKETQLSNRPSRSDNTDSYKAVIDFLELSKKKGYQLYSISSTYNNTGFFEDAKYVMELCEKYGIPEFDLDYDIGGLKKDNIDRVADELVQTYKLAKSKNLQVFGYWLLPIINKKESVVSRRNYCDNAIGNNVCISADGLCKICGYDPISYSSFVGFENFGDICLQQKLDDYCVRQGDCVECESYDVCFGQCIFQNRETNSFKLNCELIRKLSKMNIT